ncbi:MAG: MmcQ/YjbR family DNA-binding protein [Bifidobacteriaceae bacterium]|nr:MmcQ/YjbR family DNA-binding protein [Bifidobacteriaceae bacterium]
MARAWTRGFDPEDPVLARVVSAVEHLPQAYTAETWGICTLRIGRKLFGWFSGGLDDDGRRLVFKPAPSERDWLLSDARFHPAPHLRGWLELNLDAVADWTEVRELLTDSYALVAPAALAKHVGGRPA